MIAEMVIQGTHIVPMTQARPDHAAQTSACQALAIGDGKILAIGSDREIDGLVGPATRVLRLPGKTVLPGFIDSHVHFMQTGLGLLGPSVYGLTSAGEVLDALADAVARARPGEVVLLHGYDAGDVDPPLTGADLERVAPHRPIMIDEVGGHLCVINQAAWQLMDLPTDLPGVERLSSGQPSGVLLATANNVARYRFYDLVPESTRIAALYSAAALALRHGITTVHALDGGSPNRHGWLPEHDIELMLRERDRLPIHIVIYFQSTDVARALEWGLPSIGGCLYVDGAYGEHTAALLEPYTDDPTTRGVLYFADDELNDYVERAHAAGLQISMHAMGDAAIEQLLNAYERALRLHPRADHRHRIEHFSLPTAEHVERAARLGVAAGMQPNFALMPDGDIPAGYQSPSSHFLGPERYRRRHPYRKILEAGILVAGGSDSDSGAMGPLLGVHALVNHPEPERRLTPYEALALYTVNGARIAFEEQTKGTLEPGKLADLVVLGEDPLSVYPRRIKDIPVEMTIVSGRVRYQNGAAQPSGQDGTAQPSGQDGTAQPSGKDGTAQPSGKEA